MGNWMISIVSNQQSNLFINWFWIFQSQSKLEKEGKDSVIVLLKKKKKEIEKKK